MLNQLCYIFISLDKVSHTRILNTNIDYALSTNWISLRKMCQLVCERHNFQTRKLREITVFYAVFCLRFFFFFFFFFFFLGFISMTYILLIAGPSREECNATKLPSFLKIWPFSSFYKLCYCCISSVTKLL